MYDSGPSTRPSKNIKFVKRLCFFVKELLTIPLTPANLPLETKKITTAIPIKSPPIKEEKGVKLAKSIISLSKII